VLTFDGNESVDAAFTLNGPYTLTLTVSGAGSGDRFRRVLVRIIMVLRRRYGRMRLLVRLSLGSVGVLLNHHTAGVNFDGNESVDAAFYIECVHTSTINYEWNWIRL